MGDPSSEPVNSSSPKTVMVVEDEILIRLALADAIIEAGYRVFQAANADEAMVILQSRETVHLVITDVRMPGSMDGLDLMVQLRDKWPKIKTILVSGHLSERLMTEIADSAFVKPYQHSIVIQCIDKLLKDMDDER